MTATGSTGLGGLRRDIANLPPRYQCKLDPENPEHISAEIEGLILEVWLDDVCLYPTQHIAHVCTPVDGSQKASQALSPFLTTMDLTGEVSEMILTVSSIISSSYNSPSPEGSDEEMTEVDDYYDEDDDDVANDSEAWPDNWDTERLALLKENYRSVVESETELLHDISLTDECLEGLIWIRIPVADLIDFDIFTQIEADTWGLSNKRSLWIMFHVGRDTDDFKVYIRQAEHNAFHRDIINHLVRKSQVLCVIETYVRKTVIRLVENTVLHVGRTILERLGDVSKYCAICGDKSVDIPSVKPFCCSKHLCQYQYMYVDLNGTLEDILINEPTVSGLLIQLAYIAAAHELTPYPDCLTGDDEKSVLNTQHIRELLNKLPGVSTLSKMAQMPNGLQELKDIDIRLLPLLRWIILSNTAHIQKLTKEEQMIAGLGNTWHQFKMTISTPEKEAIFQRHKEDHGGNTIFAFHGSPLYNWHSILRTGLNFNKIVHGRAYGDGIYHAFQLGTSMSYAGRLARPLQDHLSPKWLKADIEVTTMLSVNEVVLDKSAFVKEQPFLVINNTEMVQTRYLIINTVKGMEVVNSTVNVPKPLPDVAYNEVAKEYQLYRDSNYQSLNTVTGTGIVHVPKDCFSISRNAKTTKKEVSQLELPSYASSIATKHLQRELRKILKTNSDATAVFSLDRTKLDNLYTWHVYLQNFASELPLAQDLQRLSLPNIQLEIKFGPQHPHTPPFIRVVQPRFLAFSHGGGGHVTAGGSICMSMLTMDDWSPVYSMSQVLIAVHSALSSIDPQPAKIADRGRYQEHEAMAAYVRVATTHGWSVPQGWTTLFNGTTQTNA